MSKITDLIAGVDEAGRGPLAGPVIAAAVILDPERPINGLKDCKLLSPTQRLNLFEIINKQALAVGCAWVKVEVIDSINILQATLLAMQQAVLQLKIKPKTVIIDGNKAPLLAGYQVQTIVGGDKLHPEISAASIIAKVTRDNMMLQLHQQYPQYNFAAHKGYGTKEHILAIKQYGLLLEHRKKFVHTALKKL